MLVVVLLEGAKVRFFCDMVRKFFVWSAELRIATFYSFGMIHAEESAAEGEADGVADAEGANMPVPVIGTTPTCWRWAMA